MSHILGLYAISSDNEQVETIPPQMSQTPPQMSQSPPHVPQFWNMSPVTFEGSDANALKHDFFTKLRAFGINIQAKNFRWQWRLEFCEGPHYVYGDCFFFQKQDSVIVEFNHLYGDRWVWWRMIHKLKGVPTKRLFERLYTPPNTSAPIVFDILKRKQPIDANLMTLIGQDVNPDDLLYLLEDDDLKIVHLVMHRLSQFQEPPRDISTILDWTTRPVTMFIEHKIVKHAHSILQKQSRL